MSWNDHEIVSAIERREQKKSPNNEHLKQKIADDVRAFLSSGGKITVLPAKKTLEENHGHQLR